VGVPLDGYLRHGHCFYRAPERLVHDSKSQVSRLAKSPDVIVEDCRMRPSRTSPTRTSRSTRLVVKRREGGRTVNVHAVGVNRDGFRACLTASRGLG
jgi:putative transposase